MQQDLATETGLDVALDALLDVANGNDETPYWDGNVHPTYKYIHT